jgi:hypothetical protein
MTKSMTRALMRLSDRDSHKAALAAGGLLVAAPAATRSVLAVVHSSMAWRQTLLRGTSRVGVALPRANPQPTPGRDRQIAHLERRRAGASPSTAFRFSPSLCSPASTPCRREEECHIAACVIRSFARRKPPGFMSRTSLRSPTSSTT